MNKETIKEKYVKYKLTKDDVFKHQHYIIITRSGIEKIAALEDISLQFDVIKCESNFAAVKCTATNSEVFVETFGSALKGDGYKDGNCNTWYVLEMAEKRAMSRGVLKLTGFYELGVFSEDESEEFKQN
tara:strand:- start:13 stop:399 length:387 start_codon:yes stop_codon:yes gene_type:complete